MPVSSYKGEAGVMLTVSEVADMLKVHATTIRRWERAGELKSYRFGSKGNIRFKSDEVAGFVERARKSPLCLGTKRKSAG